MSLLNEKPYVQSVIESLDETDLETLISAINGGEETIFRSFINVEYPIVEDEDQGVHHCILEAKDKVFTGYLIYNGSYCVLFAYQKNSQQMQILKLDIEKDEYEIVDEELSIVEFRTLVEGVSSGSVSADQINSGDVDEGKVLKADGDGGTEWGDAVKITQLVAAQYQDFYDSEGSTYRSSVAFVIDAEKQAKIQSAKMIIFTMNNSFVVTPLAQSGDTLACQSFAYNDLGASRIARIRFTFDNEGFFTVLFDSEFAQATYNNLTTKPYAALLILE